MKTKQLRSRTLSAAAMAFFTVVLAVPNASFGQVKIGMNPTAITPNANLDVEGNNSEHMVVLKNGRVGIGYTTPFTALHVRAFSNYNLPSASGIVAQFDPVGGSNINAPASLVLNGGRAAFGYAWDTEQAKYAFVRGNQNADIRLQVMDASANLHSNALVVSGRTGSYGLVGINNELPESQLDVRGTTKILAKSIPQTGAIWDGSSNINGFETTTTASTGDAFVSIQRSGPGAPLFLTKPAGATAGQNFLAFVVNGAAVGSVEYNGSGISLFYTSDQRLKENIHTTRFGLEALKTVKVYDYNFKADNKKDLSTGVLAQELHKIYPQAVSVGGADAKTNPWQVDYSRLVPMLIKSVQELNQKVELLESEKAQLRAELKRKEAAFTEFNERLGQLELMQNTGEKPAKSVSR